MNSSDGTAVQVHWIEDEPSLLALKPRWDAAWDGSRQRWPSTTWTWCASWWRHLRDGRSLAVFEVSRDGRCLGMAPFSAEGRGFRGVRTFAIAGTGIVDYADFTCLAGEEEAVAAAIARHLTEADWWDTLLLDRLLWPKERIEAWLSPFVERGHRVDTAPSLAAWHTTLQPTWDAFFAGLGRRWRERVRRDERQFSTQVPLIREPDTIDEARSILNRLYRFRAGVGLSEELPANVVRHDRFHSAVLPDLMAAGLAHVTGLQVGDTLIAAHYGFRYGDSFLWYLPGYSREWRDFSPGRAVLVHCIKTAIQGKLSIFDFGVGEEDYKGHWSAQQVPTRKVRIQSHRVGPRVRLWLGRCLGKSH